MDEELKTRLVEKIKAGTFEKSDLDDFFKLETQIFNEDEEIQEEVEGFNAKYQFKVEDGEDSWIKIETGKFSYGKGVIEDPDVIMEMTADLAVGVYTGELDSTEAYMRGELKVTGPLPNAVKFRTLTEILREILELD